MAEQSESNAETQLASSEPQTITMYLWDEGGFFRGQTSEISIFADMTNYPGTPAPPPGKWAKWTFPGWVQLDTEPAPYVKPLELRRQERLDALNRDFFNSSAVVQSYNPTFEISTWDRQMTEAESWSRAPADAKPSTPFLTSMHEQRQVYGIGGTFADLVQVVLESGQLYCGTAGKVLGIWQGARYAISVSEHPEAVVWQFPS